MKSNTRKLIGAIALPLAVGGLSALLTRHGMELYEQLPKPALSPPGWLFPIVWSILYILMGYSAYRIGRTNAPGRDDALFAYGAQLFVNFWWSIFFFAWELWFVSFFWLLLLLALTVLMVRRFGGIDQTAAKLNIPYIVWLVFAAYLNLSVALLNH